MLFVPHVLGDDGCSFIRLCMILGCLLHKSNFSHERADPYGVNRLASNVPHFMVIRYVLGVVMYAGREVSINRFWRLGSSE